MLCLSIPKLSAAPIFQVQMDYAGPFVLLCEIKANNANMLRLLYEAVLFDWVLQNTAANEPNREIAR
jgi:hypothetical protein